MFVAGRLISDARVMAHVASSRLQPTEWIQVRGEWHVTPDAYDDNAPWEVICLDCGDDQGPFAQQSEHVRRVRGPYPTREKARAAATAHTGGSDELI